MPLYYFALKCGIEKFIDRDGVDLPDHEAAREHAVLVAHELMQAREVSTRSWRLEVSDDYLRRCFEVLFAEVDNTLDHLAPPYRESINAVSRTAASLHEAIGQVRDSMALVKETFALADAMISTISGNSSWRNK